MEIWEERYESPEHGLETPKSWRLFNIVLNSINREYNEVAKEIINKEIAMKRQEFLKLYPDKEYNTPTQKEIDKKIKKLSRTLLDYSYRFNWQERIAAYDYYISKKHREEKEKMVLEWEKEQLEIALKRPFIHYDTLKQIHEATDDEISLDKRAWAEDINERAYHNSLKSIYSILHSGVQIVESTNTENIEKKISLDEEFLDKLRAPLPKLEDDDI